MTQSERKTTRVWRAVAVVNGRRLSFPYTAPAAASEAVRERYALFQYQQRLRDTAGRFRCLPQSVTVERAKVWQWSW